jgi:hypothetical protein
MANITISNLYLVGSELLLDSESYLSELVESELSIQGGLPNFSISLGSCLVSCWL